MGKLEEDCWLIGDAWHLVCPLWAIWVRLLRLAIAIELGGVSRPVPDSVFSLPDQIIASWFRCDIIKYLVRRSRPTRDGDERPEVEG